MNPKPWWPAGPSDVGDTADVGSELFVLWSVAVLNFHHMIRYVLPIIILILVVSIILKIIGE